MVTSHVNRGGDRVGIKSKSRILLAPRVILLLSLAASATPTVTLVTAEVEPATLMSLPAHGAEPAVLNITSPVPKDVIGA